MATIASEFKNSTNKISVSIRKLVYEETETFVGRVSRNTVNIDNLITEICEKNPAYNEYELKKFAKDLKAGILSNLSNAKSVNLLDLRNSLHRAFRRNENRSKDSKRDFFSYGEIYTFKTSA